MKKLLVATTNPGKLFEIKTFLSDLPIELASLTDLGISDDVEEDGTTYAQNSAKKALFYANKSGIPAVSDDGGIEIAALNNEPGIHSRRWLGPNSTEEDLIAHMKKIAKELPENNRIAYFKTVITLAVPTGETFQVKGEVKGIVAKKPFLKLLKGYPYRSFFYIPEIKKYYHEAQLSDDEQKLYNHRYKAINDLKPFIKKVFNI